MPIVDSIAGQILDDVYLIETSSNQSINGESTDIIGLVGIFQQGIPTAYYEIGDYATAIKYLGKSLATIGGPIAIQNIIRQKTGDLRVVPCFGTGAAVATCVLEDNSSTPAVFGTLTAAQIHPQKSTIYPLYGSGPNSWTVTVSINADSTFNLSIKSSSATENYTKLTVATWAATINASSNIVIAAADSTPDTNLPNAGNFAFSGGSMGALSTDTAIDAALIGDTNTDGTSTGLAKLATIADLNFVMAAEKGDATLNTELASFADDNLCIAVLCPPVGDTTSDSVISALGSISQDNAVFVDNQGIFYDADIASIHALHAESDDI